MRNAFTLLLFFIVLTTESRATVFTVNSMGATSTGASTSGTLAYCINQANLSVGPHTIQFSVAGTIMIASGVSLPALNQAITIDGTTAPGYAGAPVVIVDGTGSSGGDGLTINGANCTVLGIEIRYMPYSGIGISSSASNFRIGSVTGGCVVRNSGYYGIGISGADNGVIEYSRIGTNAAGTACEPNDYDGIDLNSNANGNSIINNHIACNGYNGLQIGNSHNNIVKGNIFGPLMGTCTSNGYRGVDLEGGSTGNIIGGTGAGEANKIAGNLYWGLEVKEAGTIRNVISGNSMSCNDYGAIELSSGGNNNIAAPVITSASAISASGTSLPYAIIEIFRAHDATVFGCPGTPSNQGADYLGTTSADFFGSWTFYGALDGFLVATQTTTSDGTSEFSAAVYTGVAPTWVNGCAGPAGGSGCINPAAPSNTTAPTALVICSGDFTTLTASGSGSLSWWDSAAGGTMLGSGGSFITPVLTDTTIFYVGDSTCDTSLTRTAITVNVVEPVSISQAVILCDGESIMVGSNTYSMSGMYMDTLMSGAGCDSIITTDLTVNPPIDVSLTTMGSTATANAAGMMYQWIDCTTMLPLMGETGQNYTATASGNYAVIISDSMGCTDTSACEPLIVVHTDASAMTDIQFWPNPVTHGTLMVKTAGAGVAEIYSLHGQVMLSERLKGGVSTMDIRTLADGIYILKVSGIDGVLTARLVVSAQ